MADQPSSASSAPEPEYDSLIVQIVDYVYDYTPTSPKAWTNARAALLDALGCTLESLALSPASRALIGPSWPNPPRIAGGLKLPGTHLQLDAAQGAFSLGVLIRYLDHNDAFLGAEWGHPSDNLGAILAVADVLTRTGTRAVPLSDVLAAQIKAYEIQGVLQIRNAYNKVGLDHVVNVKVASTAVVSWLLGLTKAQARAAVSHAWVDGHPLRTYRHFPNAGPRKGWAGGDAGMRAVHIAQRIVQQASQPGIHSALSAPRWGFNDALFRGRGLELARPLASWCVENVLFKVNCAEGHALTAVEAALVVSEQLLSRGKTAEDIAAIAIRTQEAAIDIIDKRGPLRNNADRDHCMRYMVAVVLAKGAMVEAADYQDDSPFATSELVEGLRDKITMREDPAITRAYHDPDVRSATNGLTVTLKDGSVLDEVVVDFPVGSPKRDETLALVREKAERNLRLGLGDEGAGRVLKLWDDEEGFLGRSVSEVLDLFEPGLPN